MALQKYSKLDFYKSLSIPFPGATQRVSDGLLPHLGKVFKLIIYFPAFPNSKVFIKVSSFYYLLAFSNIKVFMKVSSFIIF